MIEVIAFPDVEAMVIGRLKAAIENTHVSTYVPETRPARLIKVTRVGGSKIRINAESAMVTFQCWDETTPKAAALASLARAHIHAMEGETVAGTWVYRVRDVGGPAFNPDSTTKSARYQFTVSIDLKGETL